MINYCQVSNIRRTFVGNENCWSFRWSWSIACRRCSNYIFILDLTPGFIGLAEDNCTTRREMSKFGDLVRLILDILRYQWIQCSPVIMSSVLPKRLTMDRTHVTCENQVGMPFVSEDFDLCFMHADLLSIVLLGRNFEQNTIIFIPGNIVENAVCKMATTLFKSPYVDTT